MDSEPVRMWRDFARLNLSASWKADVDKTVTDIDLWRSILAGWKWRDYKGKWHKRHPGIKALLDEYERRQFDGIQQKGSGVHSEESVPERWDRKLPESGLPILLSRSRI